MCSDPDDVYRRERAEVGVPSHDGGSVTQRGRGDPDVMSAELSAGAELLIGDPCKARCRLIVDRQRRVLGAHPRERLKPDGPHGGVEGAQDAELELGRGYDGYGDLVGQLSERTPGLARDEDRGVRDRPAHGSSISEPRTSSRSSSSPASAPASATIRRSVADGIHGLRAAVYGTMSATGVRFTVSDSRSPERTAATTRAVLLRRSLTEISRATNTP